MASASNRSGWNHRRGWSRGRCWRPYSRRGTVKNDSNEGSRNANQTQSVPRSTYQSTTKQLAITLLLDQKVGPYIDWKLYHPEEEYTENSDTVMKIMSMQQYMNKNKSSFNTEQICENLCLQLDLIHLMGDEEFMSSWQTFNEDFSEKPLHTLNCMGLAAHQIFEPQGKVQIRPLNHQPILPLASLKVNYFGKLVTVRGTVIRVGSAGLVCTSLTFECKSCSGTQALLQPQGVFTVPTSCASCRSFGKFEPLLSSPYTITVDCQTARIQETQAQGVSGSIPRSVEVEFHGDLVGLACPGDLLSVTGIVQVRAEVRNGDDGRKSARLMQLYIEAISVHSQRTLNHPTLTFTLNDYYAIQEIHSSDNLFRLIVQSLCPSIFGQEMVKAGLILGLMGGTETKEGSRSNPHILIVGDPGLGKSQLLQAVTLAAPRGVYVCGNACTASGLTVSLTRAEGGGFTLEAGALVLADRGVCCTDELDKLGATGHGALLEAMEQGSVSVARGGVVCRLAAAPTVIAAANPMKGHYERSKTVSENLHMSAPLLSRFDLVFILLDRPNEQLDALLSEHVLALHSGEKPNFYGNQMQHDSTSSTQNSELLSDRLKLQIGEVIDPLPHELLRKYIAYAKKYVHPKLSIEAARTLQTFFLELRKSHQSNIGSSPVTTRQLEACVRLTQARARVELREEATAADAKDVIELMKHSLVDTLCDEFGAIQITRSMHGSGISARSQVKKFIDILTKRAAQLNKDIFSRSEICQLHKACNLPGNPNELIDALHVHGYVLLKATNVYKLLIL